MEAKQVILGSGGAIGVPLAKELKKFTNEIRLVSRNPKNVNTTDELLSCDLTIPRDVEKAVEGCKVAYLTVGLPYNTKTWQEKWPVVMHNVISACKKHHCALVFFDNIYMYNPEQLNPMTEETEIRPSSKKGEVRSQIAQMVLNEISEGNLKALIARSADFYGPGVRNGILNEAVVNNLIKGKKANWFCSVDYKHNFTFTPDAAKATALLGNTESAWNQVWHLPTAPPITGKEWIEKIAKRLDKTPKILVATKFMMQFLGVFNGTMKELVEMLYQYDRHYDFDSSKFETVFDMKPTPIDEGIDKTIHVG